MVLDRNNLPVSLLRPGRTAHHHGNVWPIEIGIHQADLGARQGSAQARFAATVDLPTPPFPLLIAITCLTPGIRFSLGWAACSSSAIHDSLSREITRYAARVWLCSCRHGSNRTVVMGRTGMLG